MRVCFSGSYVQLTRSVALTFCNTVFVIIGTIFSAGAQAPTITSFSPNQVCQGETVTITGTDFTNVTAVTIGAGNNVASFTVNNTTTITALVSDFATTGPVTVTTANGTATSASSVTILPAPTPALIDVDAVDAFTNCNGNATYVLKVSNGSTTTGTGNNYQIDWGDNTPFFTQTNWAAGAQTTHTYTAQGYFLIKITITPANGCTKSKTYQFYNGQNPLASFTTTNSTTGLCAPATVEFQIGNWFNNSAGTTYHINFGDGTPIVTLTHPLNASNTISLLSHLYTTSSCPNADFTATLKASNGCFTTTYTLNQILIRKKPVADFSTLPNPACLNTPVCFTNQTTNGYSGNNCSVVSSFLWDFGDGTTFAGATPPCHTYSSPGTYTVTLTASNATCGGDAKTKQLVVLPISPPPVVVTPVVYCRGQPAVPLTATGSGLLWYTTTTGGTGTATAPSPPTGTPGTTTWYVSQSIAGNCESTRVPITVTVYALPAAPAVTTPVQLCQNQATAPLTASGTGLLWYTTATGGTGSSTPPTPSAGTLGSTTYYVSQTSNTCEGPRAAIVVTVNALAGAPGVTSPLTYCQNQASAPLTAVGTGLLWYTTATGGAGSSTAPTPSTSTVGSTTWYVSQVTGCGEGPRASITVQVNPGPSASISYSPASLCNVTNGATTPNLPVAVTQTGTTGGSYSIVPAAGLPINATTGELNPSGATAGTYTIKYTIAGSGGCATYTTTTVVTVSGTPSATISYPPVCTADAPTNVIRTGAAGGTFTAPTGLIIDASTGTITPASSTPGTYAVTYTIAPSSPCPGFVTTTNVTITQAPSASIGYSPASLCNVVNTPSTPNLPVPVTQSGTTGGSYSITPATGLPINAITGELNPSGATAGTYTIKYTIAGSGGCATYTTNTVVMVSGTPTAAISYPPICTADASTNVIRTGAAGGTFTAPTGLIIDASTGTITPAGSTPGTYTVTYTIAPSSPCPGFVTTASVTITQAPSASIVYSPASLCNVVNTPSTPNAPVPVVQTGTTDGNYSIVPATGLLINTTTGELNPSGATAGTYTIKYTIPGAGGCATYTTTAVVTISGAPSASINYPGGPFCRSINTPQPVSLSGTPGGVFSAGQGLVINTITGAVNPALSAPGIYTVTYTIAASSPCPGFTATTTVQVDDSPVITFPLSAQPVCSGGTAVFTPTSTVANTTYKWAVLGALPPNVAGTASGTASGAQPVITLSFTNTGIVSQTLTVQVIPVNPTQNPCPGAPYNLTLTVNPVPVAPVPDTFDLCMGVPPVALTVTPLPGTTINWYDNNLVLLNGAPVVSTAIPAEFTYYASQLNSSNCESPKSKMLAIVHPTAKIISSSYTHPMACGIPSGSIVLHVLDLNNNGIPNMPVVVHYNKFQTAYTFSTGTDAAGKITIPLTAGTYSGIYVETSGCLSQAIPDVFILQDPMPPAQPVAGYNPPVCSETPLTLTALSPTGTQAGTIKYVWAGPAFGPFADTVSNTVITFPSAPVSYAGTYVVYAIQNNCISLPTNFQVVIKQSPSKPVVVTRAPLCIGEELSLQAYSSMPGTNAVLNYVWKGPGTGFPVNAPHAGINKVKLEDAGIYSITVSSPQTGCSSTTDTLIQIGGYPVVKFAKDTLTLPTGFLLYLAPVITNAASPGILPIKTFTWTPSRDLACNDAACSAPVATIKNNTCYTVKATNMYGCSGSAVMCVQVFCEGSQLFIPNAFTPRGNIPENAILMVRGTGIAAVKSFRVFNRWGKIVFEKNNFQPNSPAFGWDGRINGKLADPGVYVYTADVICENGIPYSYKGNVTLF